MLVKINPISGFGKTAEFARVNLVNYSLESQTAAIDLFLYENEIASQYILYRAVFLTSDELAEWGTDDLVLIDIVFEKEGLSRDVNYVWPTTTVPVEETTTTTTTVEPDETTTTTTEPEE